MNRFLKHEAVNHVSLTALLGSFRKSSPLLLLACLTLAICGCGGSGSSTSTQNGALSGNWQFSMSAPSDQSFTGNPSGPSTNSVLQGGFLVQNNGSITGQAEFSIWVTPQGASPTLCNSGTATITGTVSSGQNVQLIASIGSLDQNGNPTTQTFTLTGQLGSVGGTYTSTAGYYYPTGSNTLSPCGSAESSVPWTATSIPPITGSFQGFFHSTSNSGADLQGQVFAVTGSLSQVPTDSAASSATVNGSLIFTGYPCMSKATLNGTISGSSVVLQVFNSTSDAIAGQIGGWSNGGNGTFLVTYDNTSSGFVLHNNPAAPPPTVAYALATSSCPLPAGGTLSTSLNGDAGNICLAFGTPNPATGLTACSEPITVTPASAAFPAQLLLSGSRTRQVITVDNIQASGSSPLNLKISLLENDGRQIYPAGGDFNGFPSFTEQDNCTGNGGLAAQQSCSITVSFSPQQSCPWIPYGSNPAGLAPAKCPGPFNPLVPPKSLLSALLTVSVPSSSTPDSDSTYSIPLKAAGLSAVVPSTPELDFGSVDVGETTLSQQLAQTVTFTNQSSNPVQILPPLTGTALTAFQTACNADLSISTPFILPRPQNLGSLPPGLLVVATNEGGSLPIAGYLPPAGIPTLEFFCDLPALAGSNDSPSFQISSDGCSGTLLAANGNPGDTCAVTVTFTPQLNSYRFGSGSIGGLNYFLQLNTLQCDIEDDPPLQPPSQANPCELDSGRFPVQLTANPPGPFRMSPAAGLDFGTWLKGSISTPLSITLTNDAPDNLTVTLTGKPIPPLGGDYTETDNCSATLSPGASCVFNFTFMPSISGIDDQTLVIGYNATGSSGTQYNLSQFVYLRGIGQ